MKRYKSTSLSVLILALVCTWSAHAQQQREPEKCQVRTLENSNHFENWLQSRAFKTAMNTNEIYRIPIVVHVLHLGEPEGEGSNLSKEQIEAQIRILNEDFRRKEGTPGFNTHPDGGDARIEFLLARTSPDGKATDGIVRIDMNQLENPEKFPSSFNFYGQYSYWDPEQYLNVWTLPNWPAETLLGMATGPVTDLPGGDRFEVSDPVDGILINAPYFGPSDIDSNYNRGRTLTHEIGHFLGLLHIWGATGCDKDDYCEDTPPQNKSHSVCPATPPLACDGRPAMIENYMDYTPDRCMNIFTKDQISRMHTVLENSPRRKSLTTSPGLEAPVTGIPDIAADAIKVFPNPVADHLNIDFGENHVLHQVSITCYTSLGKKIFANHYDKISRRITLKMPVTVEKVLFLQLSSERLVVNRKLVLR